MEKKSKATTIPLDYIRGLIVTQGGRCAITGLPLDPQEVNADHVIPLSRTGLAPSTQKDNVWLVHKRINAMKGTLTYDELIDMARKILNHQEQSKKLIEDIRGNRVKPVSKKDFDGWVLENCSEDGKVKS